MKMLRLYVDGSSLGNTGSAGIGVVACDERGKIIATHKLSLLTATNNEAEYLAVIEALKLARRLGANEVTLFSDSQLVVQQLKGNYKVKSPKLQRLHKEALSLAQSFRQFNIVHIPRKSNELANKLAQEASFASSSRNERKPVRGVKISPSILSADFRKLGEIVRELEEGEADLGSL